MDYIATNSNNHFFCVMSGGQMGVITFDKDVHFYNLTEGLAQPQMLVVSDLDDIFVPLQDGMFVNAQGSR